MLGTGYHVMQKINQQRIQFPQLGFTTIWMNFFKQEWDSLMVSVLIFISEEVALFIIVYKGVHLPLWISNWGMYALCCIVSYGGQRLAYKYLNTSVEALEKKADALGNNNTGV